MTDLDQKGLDAAQAYISERMEGTGLAPLFATPIIRAYFSAISSEQGKAVAEIADAYSGGFHNDARDDDELREIDARNAAAAEIASAIRMADAAHPSPAVAKIKWHRCAGTQPVAISVVAVYFDKSQNKWVCDVLDPPFSWHDYTYWIPLWLAIEYISDLVERDLSGTLPPGEE